MQDLGQPVAIADLRLDPENPRLPEHLLGGSQDEILKYLFDNDVLEEIASSIRLNGFFPNEPVIVLPEAADGTRLVVEGNRRLATLLILNGAPVAADQGIVFSGELGVGFRPLETVPAFEVANRDDLDAYLGFRHINGIRTWGASEKARFVWKQVNKAVQNNEIDPFYVVGRAVGSNSRGVRTSYLAYELLQKREVYEGDTAAVEYVIRRRFGVWLRLLGTKNIPDQIGIDRDAKSFADVRRVINESNSQKIVEVARDLYPRTTSSYPVLADSRDVTVYSDVMGYEPAYRALRATNKLEVAQTVLDQGDFDKQLAELAERVSLVLDMVSTQVQVTQESLALAVRLNSVSRSLVGAMRELAQSGEED